MTWCAPRWQKPSGYFRPRSAALASKTWPSGPRRNSASTAATVHDLDSFGATPRGGKVVRFARDAADATRFPGAGRNAGDDPDGEREVMFSSGAGRIRR